MLPKDPPVIAYWVNCQSFPYQVSEQDWIQIAATSNYMDFGKVTYLPNHIGQDIHWVGKNRQLAVGAVLDNTGNNGLEDVHVQANPV